MGDHAHSNTNHLCPAHLDIEPITIIVDIIRAGRNKRGTQQHTLNYQQHIIFTGNTIQVHVTTNRGT